MKGPFETVKSQIEQLKQNLDEFSFLSKLPVTLRCYAKRYENFEFVQVRHFEKYWLVEIKEQTFFQFLTIRAKKKCNFKGFVDDATAARHDELITDFIEDNLLPRKKLGWELELKKYTHGSFHKSMWWDAS